MPKLQDHYNPLENSSPPVSHKDLQECSHMAAHYQTEENSGFNKDTSRLASTDLSTQDEGARPVCNAKRKSKPKHILL